MEYVVAEVVCTSEDGYVVPFRLSRITIKHDAQVKDS